MNSCQSCCIQRIVRIHANKGRGDVDVSQAIRITLKINVQVRISRKISDVAAAKV